MTDAADRLPGDGPWRASKASRTDHYHTDPECEWLAAATSVFPATESEIEWHGLEECSGCAGDAGTGTDGGPVPKAGPSPASLNGGGGT